MAVDIAVACAPSQSPKWWPKMIGNCLRWVRAGIHIHRIIAPHTALTDTNRNMAVEDFLAGDSEWLFWVDDDTVPPHMALPRLLALNRPFCAGVYYMKNEQAQPLVYKRRECGLYSPIEAWTHGQLIEADAVGMGCTLIHRVVFQEIQEQHQLFLLPDGSLYPVHKSRIFQKELPRTAQKFVANSTGPTVLGDHLVIPVSTEIPEGARLRWPFYAFAYGRTEDVWFAELARNVGFTPLVDTTVECVHLGGGEVDGSNYRRNMLEKWRLQGYGLCEV